MFRPIPHLAAILALTWSTTAGADEAGPPDGWRDAVEAAVLPSIREVLAMPIVEYTILAQNTRYADLAQADIDALDTQWREERELSEQPLISAVLSNPNSTYLTRVQAQSLGLYTEIFVMDDHGLNVGQSNISSDFWQGDEAKWLETYEKGPAAVFVDEPELRDDIGVWVVQVNVSIDKDGAPIGASTFEVNLSELARRQSAGLI
jgi:hypothetical protein